MIYQAIPAQMITRPASVTPQRRVIVRAAWLATDRRFQVGSGSEIPGTAKAQADGMTDAPI